MGDLCQLLFDDDSGLSFPNTVYRNVISVGISHGLTTVVYFIERPYRVIRFRVNYFLP
jgi:hypothetical protein